MHDQMRAITRVDADVPATVIVLVYNTPDLLFQCLKSFYDGVHGLGWQVIVVDNGSDEDVCSTVKAQFDGIEVIRSKRNLGFAAGNNLGLRAAKGEFVILMNSDVLALAEVLESLANSLGRQSQAAAMSPGLLTAQGNPQMFAFGAEPSPVYLIRRGIRSILGSGSLHDWFADEPLEVEWVSAACLCVRRSVILEIGELDERFSLYFEDTDWCMRMRAAGWKVIYNPRLHVTHLGGASQADGSAQRQDLYYRSLLLFCGKHYGRCWKLLVRLLLIVYRALKAIRSRIPGNYRKMPPN
ncbi:MAG: glycosyltransferase family 2 protein [Acidobacteria bacterium]|nr:glycosyltransferase family 2 protein [Acidobacteriota bacterium]